MPEGPSVWSEGWGFGPQTPACPLDLWGGARGWRLCSSRGHDSVSHRYVNETPVETLGTEVQGSFLLSELSDVPDSLGRDSLPCVSSFGCF